METVAVRYVGPKKTRVVELPVGLSSLGEKTGEIVCNPVGEFPADEAKKLLSIPGASGMFQLESEYQEALHPESERIAEQKQEKRRELGRRLAASREVWKEKKAAKIAAKRARAQAANEALRAQFAATQENENSKQEL